MSRGQSKYPAISYCPVCRGEPLRDKKNEWDDWGRFIDREWFQIRCCGLETQWVGDKRHAIQEWNNAVTRYIAKKYWEARK